MNQPTSFTVEAEEEEVPEITRVALQVTLAGLSSVIVFHCRLIFVVGKWIGRNQSFDDWVPCSVRFSDFGVHVAHVG